MARFLDLRESQVRVVAPDVGGGFGPKMHLYPEDLVVCAAARRLGCPVKWVEDRRENLLTMTHAREQVIEAAMAADGGGRILAVNAEIVSDAGAYSVFPLTAALEPIGTAQIIPGPYRVPAYAYTAMAVGSNKTPVGAYRGVGMAADPVEVRRINFVRADEFPRTSPTGLVYDSGRYEDTVDAALGAFRYADARVEQARARLEGRLVGIGLSTFTEYTGMGSKTFVPRGMTDVRGNESAQDRGGRLRRGPGPSVLPIAGTGPRDGVRAVGRRRIGARPRPGRGRPGGY